MLAQARVKLRNAESSLAFMREQHGRTLEGLHCEIQRLQQKNASEERGREGRGGGRTELQVLTMFCKTALIIVPCKVEDFNQWQFLFTCMSVFVVVLQSWHFSWQCRAPMILQAQVHARIADVDT